MDVLYLIMLHIDGNVDKNFQPSIFYRSRENHVSLKSFRHTDISNYRLASLQMAKKTNLLKKITRMTTSIKEKLWKTVEQTDVNTCRVSELNNLEYNCIYKSQSKIVSKFVEKLPTHEG